MRIDFLKAGNGDCIHIHGDGHHVLIDSGRVCEELRDIVNTIKETKQKIDLLVITHYDSDHIREICNILKGLTPDERRNLVSEVWFNANIVEKVKKKKKDWSAADATDLGELLREAEILWISNLVAGSEKRISPELSLEILDGGAPFDQTLEGALWGAVKTDWETPFEELEKYLDDEALDRSKTNEQSVILVAHINGHDVLLPGDAVPTKLQSALNNKYGDALARFDLVKLPHHGSYKNISKEILDKIVCSDYVILTDGSLFPHPNKKMMIKVIKWGHPINENSITFHMNYYETLFPKLTISEEEMVQYKFNCDGKRGFDF